MGIIKRSVPAKSGSSAVTIIAEGNKFCGDTQIVGKMHVDGIFEGNISSLDDIYIGKKGLVRGFVKASHVNISGRLEGEVVCDNLHIEAGGEVRANVLSKNMSIDPRGCFLGERRLQDSAVADLPAVADSGIDAIDSLPDRVVLEQQDEASDNDNTKAG
mgnify:CR=1 FL=1